MILEVSNLSEDQLKALSYEVQVIEDLSLCWEPHPEQAKVKNALFYDNKKLVFIECGRKYGKTEALCYILYRFAMLFPRSACYYIAPFQKQAKEIVWANGRLQNFFQPIVDPKTKRTHRGHTYAESLQIRDELIDKYGLRVNDSEMRLWFGNGSFLKLDGADNHQAYRGISPSIIVYDEFKDHHPKFHVGMDPNLAAFDAPLVIVGTPTEGDESNCNQFNSLADFAKVDENSAYFNAPTSCNPHISKKFLDRKKAELFARGEDDKWYREYEAKRVKSGAKSIFPMFEDMEKGEYTRHVRPRADLKNLVFKSRKDWQFFMVFDPASASTFGVLFGAINKFNKKVVILDEIYEQKKANMSAGMIFPRALEILDKYSVIHSDVRFIYDNAATWFANEVGIQFGYGLEPCMKDIKEKESRLSLIKDMFNYNFLLISEDCVKLRWEIGEYRTDENNKILKENDHLLDCLRYMLANAYYNRLEYHLIEETTDRRAYKLGEEDDSFFKPKTLNPFADIEREYYL